LREKEEDSRSSKEKSLKRGAAHGQRRTTNLYEVEPREEGGGGGSWGTRGGGPTGNWGKGRCFTSPENRVLRSTGKKGMEKKTIIRKRSASRLRART